MSAVFIPISHLDSPTIVCTLRTQQDNKIHVSISCDRDGPDPEFLEPASSRETGQSTDAGAERVMVDETLVDDESDEGATGDDDV